MFKLEMMLPLWWLSSATADITVFFQNTHRELDVEFRDLPASFGALIPPEGLRAYLMYANPANACETLLNPPNTTLPNITKRWAVLVRRYECSFERKVRVAQAAGFDIVIVHNVNSSDLEQMSANDPRGIVAAAVFVSERTGHYLQANYLYNKGFYIKVDDNSPFDINTHLLLPFAFVVGICFCTMLGFMIVKCYKDYRRARRHRLPSSSLKKIPIAKFRKGDPYETCAICLEDFVEEEKLRILPCSHAYHCKCIDPWLTRNRRVCPVCKRKVFAADEVGTNMSDSDSDSDIDDRTPLVRSSGHSTQGGTFASTIFPSISIPRGSRQHTTSEHEGSAPGPSSSAHSIQHPDEYQYVDHITATTTEEASNPFEIT